MKDYSLFKKGQIWRKNKQEETGRHREEDRQEENGWPGEKEGNG